MDCTNEEYTGKEVRTLNSHAFLYKRMTILIIKVKKECQSF